MDTRILCSKQVHGPRVSLVAPSRVPVRAVQGSQSDRRQEHLNKSSNPAVNERGSLQHFFYALLIPQGDEHNAEPAPGATSQPRRSASTADYLILCVSPFKPPDKYSHFSVDCTGGPSLFICCPSWMPVRYNFQKTVAMRMVVAQSKAPFTHAVQP